jgi:DNA-binding LacI/PurR family transcriptional regulator
VVTIADVARAAGVSNSTVSYVLSGKRPISGDTRKRVEESIKELGYRPNAGARALASSRTNVLALVAPLRRDIVVPVIMQFATAVVLTARDEDHDVLLLTHDEGPDGIERVASSAMVDALIVMDVEDDDPRIPVLAALRQPAVLIGLPKRSGGLSCVDLDFTAAGNLAVQHVAGHGHTEIGLVGPSPAVYERGTSYARRFLAGVDEAVDALGIRVDVEPCEPTFDGVRTCLDRIGRKLPDATALIVHNETALPPLLNILRERGQRVPEDLSILAL